jgi:hypothetical protein
MFVCNMQMFVCLIYVLSVVIYVGKKLYRAKTPTLNKTFMLYALQAVSITYFVYIRICPIYKILFPIIITRNDVFVITHKRTYL